MAKRSGSSYNGAVLRLARQERVEAADPAAAARRHEEAFLRGLNSAKDELAWIEEHRAWLQLGHESYVAWWADRVQPVLESLALRPAPDMARRVMNRIHEEQKALPGPQRMSKAEIAKIVGASEWVGRGRQDQHKRRTAAYPDLEGEFTDNTGTAAEASSGPADGGAACPTSPPPATGPGAQTHQGEADRPGPVVTPTDHRESNPGDAAAASEGKAGAGGDAADPEDSSSSASEVAEGPVQDGDRGVTRPAPDPSDPAALLVYCADLWSYVDFEAAGPMLTSDDMRLINGSLLSIANGVEALVHWRDKTQP